MIAKCSLFFSYSIKPKIEKEKMENFHLEGYITFFEREINSCLSHCF